LGLFSISTAGTSDALSTELNKVGTRLCDGNVDGELVGASEGCKETVGVAVVGAFDGSFERVGERDSVVVDEPDTLGDVVLIPVGTELDVFAGGLLG